MTTFTKTGGVISPRAAGGASQYTNDYAYLVITDGTTTITFQDGAGGETNYILHRQVWAPVIAGLRRSQLGGRTPYEDVVEELPSLIRGTSAQDAYAKLAALARLLEQAERWARGENVTAVVVKFVPKGALLSSLANPLQATILGRAGGDETAGVALSGEWNAAGTHYVIPTVRVRFVRRGLWLTLENSANPAAFANGELVTFALPACADPSPTRIDLSNFGYGKTAATRFHGGFILLGEPVGGSVPITLAHAEAGTTTGYTSVADAGANARNGSVLRYTPPDTAENSSGQITAALPTATRLAAVFVSARHSATVSFKLRVAQNSAGFLQYTQQVAIPAAATLYPKWYFCGLIAATPGNDGWFIYVTASAASSFLDIDAVVVCDARAVQSLALPGPEDTTPNTVTAAVDSVALNHNLLTEPAPEAVWAASGNPDIDIPYHGDAVLSTRAGTLYGLLLATGGGSGTAGNEWRLADVSTDAVLANAWTVSRRSGLLVPQ